MKEAEEKLVCDLTALLGEEAVLTSKEDLLTYGFDSTACLKAMPCAVVFPTTTEEVAECIKCARKAEISVVTRGSGTGLSGGSVPLDRALVVCLVKMNRILQVDEENLTIRAEAGVITAEIDKAANAVGLFYPPDPGSMKISTIGGNVAENSGGLRGLKYGVTRDFVLELTVVMPDGKVVRLGNQCVKDVAGYSMKDLFIGSEGTLGVVTEVMLKLLPVPADRKTMLASFPTIEDAARTVSDIVAAKIIPCTLEFLDQMTIQCVEEYAEIGLPTDCAALVLMECDGHPEAVADEAKEMVRIAERNHATKVKVAADSTEALVLSSARRSAFSALARRRPTTILEDITVPRNRLAEMVSYIAQVADEMKLKVGTFGHLGDGNLHPTFLTDERDEEEMKRVHEALDKIVDKTLGMGGTITGEHGVGLAKKGWLRKQIGDDSLQLMKQIKKTLDPDNLLNPGKIFD